MENQPKTLSINVTDDIKTKDIPPGETSLNESSEYYQQAINRCVPAHNVKSRWVTLSDVPLIIKEAKILLALCNLTFGDYTNIPALAHTQINDKDPLRFFVLNSGVIIINPIIINHTKVPVLLIEGCISYPKEKKLNLVPRYNKITVTFQTVINPKDDGNLELSTPITKEFNTRMSQIFQHEISHLNGFNIYDKGYQAENSVGFGDKTPIDPKIWDEKK